MTEFIAEDRFGHKAPDAQGADLFLGHHLTKARTENDMFSSSSLLLLAAEYRLGMIQEY